MCVVMLALSSPQQWRSPFSLITPPPSASLPLTFTSIRCRRTASTTSSHLYSIILSHHNHKKYPFFHPLHKPHKKSITPLLSSSSAPPAPPPPPPSTPPQSPAPPQQGAKPFPLIFSLAIGAILYLFIPRPSELTPQAWQLLSIFLSTIAGLILSPLPVGAWAFLGLTATVLTGTFPLASAFSAFTNQVIWLIVISFFFARGFVKTGLGDRIAMYFVKWLGKSTLGLSYGLTLSEALIAPAIPSTTARAGGVFLPIIQSLSLSAGSKPRHPSMKKLGSFLIHTQFQLLLCLKLAEELGVVISNPWLFWFQTASLPAIFSLISTPLILYNLCPPEIKDTPDAPAIAASKLDLMGPLTRNQLIMMATMLLAVTLWVFGDTVGITNVVAAMLGLSILLLTGLEWDDCLSEKSAWDTFAWFAIVVGMAEQLTGLGIVSWMSGYVSGSLVSLSLSWPIELVLLQLAYFTIHYMFASQTGHVGALYSAFLAMHLASGVPGGLSALALAYNTSLFGALTHYSSGQAAVYFGAGYMDLPDVFKYGFIMAVVNLVIWGVAVAEPPLAKGWLKPTPSHFLPLLLH